MIYAPGVSYGVPGPNAAEQGVDLAARCHVYRRAVVSALQNVTASRLVQLPDIADDSTSHVRDRHAPAGGQLLRYRNGQPITTRRYDHLWHRIGQHLPWVAAQQISTHWLRHTTLTWVERNFSYAVAHAYAGHTDGRNDPGTTATYIRADVDEIAAALTALTDEPHPLG